MALVGQISAVIFPLDATNQGVLWKSSNASVVTVSPSGLVTAQGVGAAVITARTQDGGFSATCIVNVKAQPAYLGASNLGVDFMVEIIYSWNTTFLGAAYLGSNYGM